MLTYVLRYPYLRAKRLIQQLAVYTRQIKIIRQAQRDEALPIHIHAIPLDQLNFGVFSDAAWGVRPDGSSQGGF